MYNSNYCQIIVKIKTLEKIPIKLIFFVNLILDLIIILEGKKSNIVSDIILSNSCVIGMPKSISLQEATSLLKNLLCNYKIIQIVYLRLHMIIQKTR